MRHRKQVSRQESIPALTPALLKSQLKLIGGLNRTGMAAGNNGNFDEAFHNLKDAISLSRELDKKCLEAKLLNNLGTLHTMSGAWENALEAYNLSMSIVSDHYGPGNVLYRTLQKNIAYLFGLDARPAGSS